MNKSEKLYKLIDELTGHFGYIRGLENALSSDTLDISETIGYSELLEDIKNKIYTLTQEVCDTIKATDEYQKWLVNELAKRGITPNNHNMKVYGVIISKQSLKE